MSIALATRRFTVEEYHRMGEAGILGPEDRVELLDGEVVEMSPIGREHAACVARLDQYFQLRLQGRVHVRVQNPVRLSDHSEPEPDVALVRPHEDFYVAGHPSPADVFLLVEVADSSLAYDRRTKVPQYAAAGIPEVWVVDLTTRTVEVFRRPGPKGYDECRRASIGDSIAPACFLDCSLRLDQILGK